jgi:hypothetical protein
MALNYSNYGDCCMIIDDGEDEYDVFIYDKSKNLCIMSDTNFIINNKNIDECYITGKLVDGEIVPLNAADLMIVNKLPIKYV